MKKILSLLLFSPLLFSTQIHAQGQMEFFGLRSWAIPRPEFTDKGWGGGMNYLSHPIALNGKGNVHPFDVQLGGQFYLCGLGMRKFRGVPLDEPLTGNAKVKFDNLVLGGNLFVRFSAPNATTGYMPYLDILGGGRLISSGMTVFPDYVPAGYDASTNSELKSVGGWNYGAGIGLQKKISDNVNFDCELIWSYSPTSNSIVNLASVQRSGDGIIYDVKNSPNSVMLLKVGFNFRVENGPCASHSSSHHSSCSSSNQHYSSQGRSSSVHVSSGGGHASGGVHAVAK